MEVTGGPKAGQVPAFTEGHDNGAASSSRLHRVPRPRRTEVPGIRLRWSKSHDRVYMTAWHVLLCADACGRADACGGADACINLQHCTNTVQHCTALYSTVRQCTTLCDIVQHCTTTVLCSVVQCCTILRGVARCYTVYSVAPVLYSFVQHCATLCNSTTLWNPLQISPGCEEAIEHHLWARGGGHVEQCSASQVEPNYCPPLLYRCPWCMRMRIPRRWCTEHACLSEVHVGSDVCVRMYVRPCRYL